MIYVMKIMLSLFALCRGNQIRKCCRPFIPRPEQNEISR